MSKDITTTWKPCLFVGREFLHCTYNGNRKYVAYVLVWKTILHKFYYYDCTPIANTMEQLKPLEKVIVTTKCVRGKNEITEIKKLKR